jgi:ABC-type nickel/cobalt efflux system permease component RcnA
MSRNGVFPALLGLVGVLMAGTPVSAHPMGNFSISHYTAITISNGFVELRYVLDMAEIPTYQQIQQNGIKPDPNDPSVVVFLQSEADAVKQNLLLEVDGRRLALEPVSKQVIFPPGAGGLATMKMGFVFRAPFASAAGAQRLQYRDLNFSDRAGWKEVVASADTGVILLNASVPQHDRSNQLGNYPTDLLNSPPQVTEAAVTFSFADDRNNSGAFHSSLPGAPASSAPAPASPEAEHSAPVQRGIATGAKTKVLARPHDDESVRAISSDAARDPLQLRPNEQRTPQNRFTELIAASHYSPWFLLLAALIAAGLGALHALEPGHGKTIVAAYLVGSKGTATHAFLLGLIVTASHTAGVYLLGLATLFASHYIVSERIYPWLNLVSGLIIAGVGFAMFLRRYAGKDLHLHSHHHQHPHGHSHEPPHAHVHDHAHGHHDHVHVDQHRALPDHQHAHSTGNGHEHHHDDAHVPQPVSAGIIEADATAHHAVLGSPGLSSVGLADHHSSQVTPHPHHGSEHHIHHHHHGSGHHHHHHHEIPAGVSSRQLLALGITGGMVPCPAALMVLLGAVTLHRIAFGLFLIVAFSVGLAAVLIVIGLMMVYAGRLMSRFRGEGKLLTRWLPLTSAAVITVLGLTIAVRALISAGILQIRL